MSATIAAMIAIVGLLTAVLGLVRLFRKVDDVHVLVNSQLSKMLMRVEQLTGVLQGAGLDVPERLTGNGPPTPPAAVTGEGAKVTES